MLGSHDGIGSWTINLHTLPEAAQRVVTQHEHAHHHLQSSTAWGVAMVAAAVVDQSGRAAESAWIGLAQRSRRVHEMFATYHSALTVDDGLEHYRGNMQYLQFYGWGSTLVDGLNCSPTGHRRAIEDLSRALMSPSPLTDLTFDAVRELGTPRRPWPRGPDDRLTSLLESMRNETLKRDLGELFDAVEDSGQRWDHLAAALTAHGIDCPDLARMSDWTRSMVVGCNAHLGVPIEVQGRVDDPLLALVDNHSRERLRLHADRLPLQVGFASEHEPRPIADFAREATGVGPHVWLTWLPADFIARQFVLDRPLQHPLVLSVLACDRRGDHPGAYLCDFTPAQPAMVAHAVLATPVRPLFFTTVRALHHSGDDVDFRLWDPVLVLVDSDARHFLTHLGQLDETYVWHVLGIGGSRSIDFVLVRAESTPVMTYLLPCSIPASRVMTAWLDTMSFRFRRSADDFIDIQPWLRAQVDHLVGTFYVLDQFGADINLTAPAGPAPSLDR